MYYENRFPCVKLKAVIGLKMNKNLDMMILDMKYDIQNLGAWVQGEMGDCDRGLLEILLVCQTNIPR